MTSPRSTLSEAEPRGCRIPALIAATAPRRQLVRRARPLSCSISGYPIWTARRYHGLREWSQVPIIVFSARDREGEKIAALDLGADDYVAKPFGIGELLARIRTLLRHRSREEGETTVFKVGGLVVDTLAHTVTRNGEGLRLTPKEYDVLHLLVRNAGRVMTHRQILQAVWGPANVEDTQYLRVFVGRLRQKIEADPSEPQLIVTEPGVGYRFKAMQD